MRKLTIEEIEKYNALAEEIYNINPISTHYYDDSGFNIVRSQFIMAYALNLLREIGYGTEEQHISLSTYKEASYDEIEPIDESPEHIEDFVFSICRSLGWKINKYYTDDLINECCYDILDEHLSEERDVTECLDHCSCGVSVEEDIYNYIMENIEDSFIEDFFGENSEYIHEEVVRNILTFYLDGSGLNESMLVFKNELLGRCLRYYGNNESVRNDELYCLLIKLMGDDNISPMEIHIPGCSNLGYLPDNDDSFVIFFTYFYAFVSDETIGPGLYHIEKLIVLALIHNITEQLVDKYQILSNVG